MHIHILDFWGFVQLNVIFLFDLGLVLSSLQANFEFCLLGFALKAIWFLVLAFSGNVNSGFCLVI